MGLLAPCCPSPPPVQECCVHSVGPQRLNAVRCKLDIAFRWRAFDEFSGIIDEFDVSLQDSITFDLESIVQCGYASASIIRTAPVVWYKTFNDPQVFDAGFFAFVMLNLGTALGPFGPKFKPECIPPSSLCQPQSAVNVLAPCFTFFLRPEAFITQPNSSSPPISGSEYVCAASLEDPSRQGWAVMANFLAGIGGGATFTGGVRMPRPTRFLRGGEFPSNPVAFEMRGAGDLRNPATKRVNDHFSFLATVDFQDLSLCP